VKPAKPTLDEKNSMVFYQRKKAIRHDGIINRLVDNSEFEPYKDGYGQTIITGYARIDGWAVGIAINVK
jgi:acetyl-CoA carboxylase carboxyltransferase component